MRKTLFTLLGAVMGIGLVAVGAYGFRADNKTDIAQPAAAAAPQGQPGATGEVQGRQQAAGKSAKAAAGQAKVLKVSQVPGLTPIVTSASGRTVYRFDNDSANPSKTTCLGECAQTWEPVLAGAGVVVEGGGIDQNLLDTVDRPEGKQVTLKGWPLYYFKDDVQLGELAGQGRGDVWFAASPTGGKAKSTSPSTEKQDKPAKADVQVLTVNTVDGFMPFVTNGKGRTIYRFDNDSAKPPTTTCFGDCLKKWQPVLAGKNGFEIKGNKIKKSDVGTIDRREGKQLTLKGWPLYYFHKDLELGQTAGYGVGNVWFAIAPDGKKAPRCP